MASSATNVDLLAAALSAGAYSANKQIFLVAQCGEKFAVNVELAKASSDYFVGTFTSGMTESGKGARTYFLHLHRVKLSHKLLRRRVLANYPGRGVHVLCIDLKFFLHAMLLRKMCRR